jgi:hypothetical protein
MTGPAPPNPLHRSIWHAAIAAESVNLEHIRRQFRAQGRDMPLRTLGIAKGEMIADGHWPRLEAEISRRLA